MILSCSSNFWIPHSSYKSSPFLRNEEDWSPKIVSSPLLFPFFCNLSNFPCCSHLLDYEEKGNPRDPLKGPVWSEKLLSLLESSNSYVSSSQSFFVSKLLVRVRRERKDTERTPQSRIPGRNPGRCHLLFHSSSMVDLPMS